MTDDLLIFAPEVTLIAKTQLLHGGVLSLEANADQDQGTDAERIIEFAGRGCYDSYGRGRDSASFHKNIKAYRHGSCLEHVSWTFEIRGVSRGLTHELVRHRVGTAISQRSTRYTDESKSRIVVPPVFIDALGDTTSELDDKAFARDALLRAHKASCKLYECAVEASMRVLPQRSMSKTARRKTARGAARSVLGQDIETTLTWTVNARSFINAAMQRYNEHAEAEIRRLFKVLFEIIKPDLPNYLGDVKEVPSPDGLGAGINPDTLWVL